MIDWNAITPHLSAKLDPKHITQRTQSGRTLDYIEGWHALAEANRIFGFGAWSQETVEMREVRSPEQVNGNWRVGFICKVRAVVGDVVRDGWGYGSGISKDLGDAYESAVKEAETDASKRALRTFGNQFGLALYDKSRANVGVDRPAGAPVRPVETPHDPTTGEVVERQNPAQAASQGLRDAWLDGVRDSLPLGYGPAQFWGAVADALIGAFHKLKSEKGVASQWDKRDALIMEMQGAHPASYHRVLDAFNARMADLREPVVLGEVRIA